MQCDIDHAPMKLRQGRNGQFWGCSNYPNCTNTKPYKEEKQQQTGRQVTSNALQDEILSRLAERLESIEAELVRLGDNYDALSTFFRTLQDDQGGSVQGGLNPIGDDVRMRRFRSQNTMPTQTQNNE